jgi:hypothetical protein
MDTVDVDTGKAGTTVTMTKQRPAASR